MVSGTKRYVPKPLDDFVTTIMKKHNINRASAFNFTKEWAERGYTVENNFFEYMKKYGNRRLFR